MQADVQFLFEIGTLRFIQRAWRQFLYPQAANISEHIYRVTWIALILAKYEKIKNTEKLIKMALVHDIVESRSGDANYLSRQYGKRNEEKAIADMLKDTAVAAEFIALWKEYERMDCQEARIVKDADNLDVDLELAEMTAMGAQTAASWPKIRKYVAEKKLYTQSAKRLWIELQKTPPHEWHSRADNRFNAGDWKQKQTTTEKTK